MLFSKLKSVVLTSATIATGGNEPFRMFCSSMGLEGDNVMLRRYGSVFNYEKQAKIVVLENMPEQSAPDYISRMIEQVKKYVLQTNGNAFVLFTSFKTMNEVVKGCRTFFDMKGLTTLVQGGEMGRKQMLDKFKATRNSVLFGVESFWTGCDVPGDHLQNVIITKLPFEPPDDPIAEAQTEIYESFKRNYFMERAVPQAAIKLKQGFGRLIRRQDDSGMVVILDSRILTKKYGKLLLDTLPKCPVEKVRI